jgi:hypothetical protein
VGHSDAEGCIVSGIVIEEFTPVVRNSLVGFARVRMPSGVVFHDVGIYKKDGKAWATPSGKPMLGRDGTQMRGRDGKAIFVPIVSFATKETRDRFSNAVLEALRVSHPNVLGRVMQ